MWEFTVAPGHEAEFQAAYGPGGEWAALFQGAQGYLRTDLLRDQADPLRFLTIDHWASEAAWAEFKQQRGEEFRALDARCEARTFTTKTQRAQRPQRKLCDLCVLCVFVVFR